MFATDGNDHENHPAYYTLTRAELIGMCIFGAAIGVTMLGGGIFGLIQVIF